MISVEKISYYKPHWHDNTLEFIFVLEGSIDAVIGCDSYRMREGHILLIGAEDVHSYRKTNDHNSVLIFKIDCNEWEAEFPGIRDWNLIADPAVEESNKADFDRLRFFMAEAVLRTVNPQHVNENREDISRLLKYCRDTFLSTNLLMHKQDISKPQMETFVKLNRYIQKNFRKALSLGDVSEYTNYSFTHTSYLIKQITGMSFIDYLNHVRSLAAERMLISTDLGTTEIAFDCGFSDSRALSRYFKKWYKTTPSDYRSRVNELFPGTDMVSSTILKTNKPEVIKTLESYLNANSRNITINMSSGNSGVKFNLPKLGMTDLFLNSDDFNALTKFITEVIEERVSTVKLTDDAGKKLFNGDCGLVTHTGISKSVFYIFDFISTLEQIIRKEDGIIIGTGGNDFIILLYAPETPSKQKTTVQITFDDVEHDYLVKRYRVDNRHGNPYYLWEKLGRPDRLSAAHEEMIIKHSVPALDLYLVENQSTFEIGECLPIEGALMIKIEKVIND